jgi:hypothetical protein
MERIQIQLNSAQILTPYLLRTHLNIILLSTARKGFVIPTSTTRLALGPTKPPIQFAPGLFPWGKGDWSVKLITHLRLVPG